MTVKADKRYLNDLVIGEVRTSKSLTVDKQHMIAFAKEYDPQYFHVDEIAAQQSRFGDVIASGQYTMMLWRKLDNQIAHDIAWICGIGWDDVRWPVAVRGGDMLRARSCCLNKRASAKDPTRGVVQFQYQLLNQTNDVVFTAISTNLIEHRHDDNDLQ